MPGSIAHAPILCRDDHHAPSVFLPENLLREARRQKCLPQGEVPPVCVLDPDGDLAEHLRASAGARRSGHWPCFHTALWEWTEDGLSFGVVDRAVGAPFAVLVAEQLFASGCQLLVSLTSAGLIAELGPPPYFILVERALRDEGTSYHYLPPARFIDAPRDLITIAGAALAEGGHVFHRGATWTTDAPFRETSDAIAARRDQGILAVEMEAAALYAFAAARRRAVLCLAQVTNRLGRVEGDFGKGEASGARAARDLITRVARAWHNRPLQPEGAA